MKNNELVFNWIMWIVPIEMSLFCHTKVLISKEHQSVHIELFKGGIDMAIFIWWKWLEYSQESSGGIYWTSMCWPVTIIFEVPNTCTSISSPPFIPTTPPFHTSFSSSSYTTSNTSFPFAICPSSPSSAFLQNL